MQGSYLSFDDHDLTKARGHGSIITVSSSTPNDWRFKASSFKFADSELIEGSSQIDISLALNGFGLPEDEYMTVARKLYGVNSKIQCHSSTGTSCHTDTTCQELLPQIKNLKFRIVLEDLEWFEIPIAALMRENPTKGCDFLVTNLGKNSQASNFVLGSAFLQQFLV